VELDRQAIERRDFPIGRRGYDTAAVDAHLRALAAEIERLQQAGGGSDASLAATASSQVQSIIAAAETAAAEIERQAQDDAREMRDTASRDAQSTREEAVAKARAHVAAVEQATTALLERVGSMDAEASALTDSLRAGAGKLADDLAAVERGMGELYDAASGGAVTRAVAGEPAQPSVPAPPAPAPPAPAPPHVPTPPAPPGPGPQLSPPEAAEPDVHVDPEAPVGPPAQAPVPAPHASAPPAPAPTPDPSAPGDVDGARLIALNMALNGEPRADVERYLAENFQLPDSGRLVDEVYAAIEG
jgi:hypothetical protein